jgi:hypothetical protein
MINRKLKKWKREDIFDFKTGGLAEIVVLQSGGVHKIMNFLRQ